MSVVADIMEWDVVTIPPIASVSDIVHLARELERVPEAMRWTYRVSGKAPESNPVRGIPGRGVIRLLRDTGGGIRGCA